jgi:hypothetical protein
MLAGDCLDVNIQFFLELKLMCESPVSSERPVDQWVQHSFLGCHYIQLGAPVYEIRNMQSATFSVYPSGKQLPPRILHN